MNTTEALERIRQTGMLPSVAENWGDTQILAEGTEALRTRFAEDIINTGSGYWRQQVVINTVVGQNEYRIPARSVVQGLQKFEISRDGGVTWQLMRVLSLGSDGLYESANRGIPTHYTHYSDYVRVFPTPGSNTTKFRFSIYLRPSKLIATVSSGTVVSTSAGHIIVSGDPTAYLSASGGLLDVVNTTGCNEVALFDVPFTSVVSAGGGNWNVSVPGVDLTKVFAGQVLRAADTTDQIPLPLELHNGWCAYTAASILQNQGDNEQADKIASKAGNDIRRILDLAIPRDKQHPQKIKPRSSWLRRNAGRTWR